MFSHTGKNILVTGATGFVGIPLCKALITDDWIVRGAVRSEVINDKKIGYFNINDINSDTNWSVALKDINVVMHLAARVHVMQESSADPLAEFRKVNVEGTKQLAIQAAKAGVKRFVYVSSIKVNGEKTSDKPFNEIDPAAPEDAYGISKYEAEIVLHEVALTTGLEVVIIRPPLIYGHGVKGNFLQMANVLKKGLPLPFASVNNARSLLYIGNLVDALILCAKHPNAVGKTYLISDGEDVSTPGLLKAVAQSLGLKARLLNCPVSLLRILSRLIGRKEPMNRLLDSLQVDNSRIKHDLGWEPKVTLGEGLVKTFEANRPC